MNELQGLFDKYKCDKGSLKHRYDRVYHSKLNELRNKKISFLEIGILKGNSIHAWIDYFTNSEIYCIDTFERIRPNKIDILKNERVHWCKCDSINGPLKNFNKTFGQNIEFDVIIDDGKHTHYAQRKTFEKFFPYLKIGGVYFIEDVWPFDIMTKKEHQNNWLVRHKKEFPDKEHDNLIKMLQCYDTTFHDLRKGYEPDTFIIEIRK